MSVKAALVVLWACLIAGAAIASESQRLCELHAKQQLHEEKSDVLIVAEFDVTN